MRLSPRVDIDSILVMPITERITGVGGIAPSAGYSHAVVASGRLAFISGQVALDEAGNVVGAGNLAEQTAQALRNLRRIIGALGADWSHVVRFGWYVVDATAVQVVRDVRDDIIEPELGDRPKPASSLVQVAALFRPEFLIEVDAVVAVPE